MCGYSGTLGVYYLSDGDSELHCYHCGADYCAYDGLEKSGRYRAQLTLYYPEPTVKENLTVPKLEPKSKLEVANETFQTYRHNIKLIT